MYIFYLSYNKLSNQGWRDERISETCCLSNLGWVKIEVLGKMIKETFSVDLQRSLLDTHQSPWSCKILKNLVYQNFPNSWTSQEVACKPIDKIVFLSYTIDKIVFLSYTFTLSHWIHLKGEHHQNTERYLGRFGLPKTSDYLKSLRNRELFVWLDLRLASWPVF